MKIVEREVKVLSKLDNNFVVNYMDSWKESQNIFCIQMEFCEYDLQAIITLKNNFSPSLQAINYYISCEIYREILECVQYLHSRERPVIHRDLKPQNILIKMNYNTNARNARFVKLCDFGIAVEHKIKSNSGLKSQSHTQNVGTDAYIAPEVRLSRDYNTKADIFSLGMIAYNLFEKKK